MNSKEGVASVIKLLEAYDLTREDWDSIMEAGLFEGQRDPMTKIPSKVILFVLEIISAIQKTPAIAAWHVYFYSNVAHVKNPPIR